MVYIWVNLVFLTALSLIIFLVIKNSKKNLFFSTAVQHNLIYFFSPLVLIVLNLILCIFLDRNFLYSLIFFIIVFFVLISFIRIKAKILEMKELKLFKSICYCLSMELEISELDFIVNVQTRHGTDDKKTILFKTKYLFNDIAISLDELKRVQKNLTNQFHVYVEFNFKDLILKENGNVLYKT
ncbi:hypothetical protein ACQKNC_07350 [Lysinibacillus sp. NPDC094177]|uniref:hypothetical protein n=1 Tax=Lysinibacillus sp. NPDC094177 TaxID=3390580 RepID=UPI003CFE2A53